MKGRTPGTGDWELQERLRHVYWIGGGSGGGKSTIARRIAEERGLQLFVTDDVMPDHARRSAPDSSPFLQAFIAMDMDERWVNRSPQSMLDTFHWFHGEGFDLIIEDLLRLPRQPGIVVEGLRLLPHLVKPLLADQRQAVWLLPTPEFREAVFESRGGTQWAFIGKTGNPQRALRNLLERDAMFTTNLYEETRSLSLNNIQVDGSRTADDMTSQVMAAFGL